MRDPGIDDDSLLRHRIADDRAIAAKGREENVFRIMPGMMNACYCPSPSRRKQWPFLWFELRLNGPSDFRIE